MNSFGTARDLKVGNDTYRYYDFEPLRQQGFDIDRLPYSLRILLENLLRHEDGSAVTKADIQSLAGWSADAKFGQEIAFTPSRVLLQDFTGVPALVDLAAMRDAMEELGGDPRKINPSQPVELVIDHSVQVDMFGSSGAFERNEQLDYERNEERYAFIKWGREAFQNFIAAPPNAGICHQINLEHLARVVFGRGTGPRSSDDLPFAYPDTVVGTDSHTPMVNGLGVLGWGVGGIEAEAAMLGQPISMLVPRVVGFRLIGALPDDATSTDLVLTVAQMLRRQGVVGQFVEFFGPGIASLSLADRATIGNMSPEYGSTCAIFPVDQVTLDYLRFTGRDEPHIALVETYMKRQRLFHEQGSPEPIFSNVLELDLGRVQPSISGPSRPQDRIPLSEAKTAFERALPHLLPNNPARSQKTAAIDEGGRGNREGVWGEGSYAEVPEMAELCLGNDAEALEHGSVVIAAITSCTNTSNPSVMIAAGLLARNAVRKGLKSKPWVKTSLAPGSRVVTDYYEKAGLTSYLEDLGFHLVGYGCTTCIGNSGPLPAEVSDIIDAKGLVVAAVLSGNRNFEGRINSAVRANYLMSPPLVIAFALAGKININFSTDPIGEDAHGHPVYLREIWPSPEEIENTIKNSLESRTFRQTYERVFDGSDRWNSLQTQTSDRFKWDERSTYIRRPTYFDGMSRHAPEQVDAISNARVIAVLGDSVTTDHISPAGSIKEDSPAGRYLKSKAVEPSRFNSYGSRRGNHEVMVRGTLANSRIRNRLVPDIEGPLTRFLPSGEILPIYDAAMLYQQSGIPLIILAGKEYGSGSSRDWAAKGVALQGVRAVIAESYERIHRSNLVGMGVLPLQFVDGQSTDGLGLSGEESFSLPELGKWMQEGFESSSELVVVARRQDGTEIAFDAVVRIDTPQELCYYRHGGILPFVLRRLLNGTPDLLSPVAAVSNRRQPTHGANHLNGKVEEGSIESFPASDPPTY